MDETDEIFTEELDAHGDAAESAVVLALTALYAANNQPSEEQIRNAISGVMVPYLLAILILLSTVSSDTGETAQMDFYQVAEELSAEAADLLSTELANMTRQMNRDPNTRGFDGTDFRARMTSLVAAVLTIVTSQAMMHLARLLGFRFKVWKTRLDVRVRLSHQSLEGQMVPLNSVFRDYRKIPIEYPGDRSTPIDMWINCRCRLGFSRRGEDA